VIRYWDFTLRKLAERLGELNLGMDSKSVVARFEAERCAASCRSSCSTVPLPEMAWNDAAKLRDYSAVTHVAKGKGIPPFLILHVADHPDVRAQAERLEAVLKNAGIPAKRFAAKETNHSKLNENLGLPDDPPTKALFEFVDEVLK
jgi:acetyl esterase/lipase